MLCDTYKWPPGFWRRMGWREFWAWVRECRELREAKARAHTADPESWDGAENDGWWAEARAKRDRMRGR